MKTKTPYLVVGSSSLDHVIQVEAIQPNFSANSVTLKFRVKRRSVTVPCEGTAPKVELKVGEQSHSATVNSDTKGITFKLMVSKGP